MQETVGLVWMLLLAAFFLYSMVHPHLLVKLFRWNSQLIGWKWPAEHDIDTVRWLAAIPALLFLGAVVAMVSGYW